MQGASVIARFSGSGALLALLVTVACARGLAGEPSSQPTPTPEATANALEQQSSDVDPTSPTKAWTLVGTYSGASYPPGDHQVTTITPREEVIKLGDSIVRATLPSVTTVRGGDSGWSDSQLFYIFHRRGRPHIYSGVSMWFPTATGTSLGTGKWSIGTSIAYVDAQPKRHFFEGLLLQSFFSFAGPSTRSPQDLVTLQPVYIKQLGDGWSIRSADATWLFDLHRGSSLIALSAGIGKLVKAGQQTLNFVFAYQAIVIHANTIGAPKSTFKLLIRINYPKTYPQR